MWADIADWLKVNILNNPQILRGIIAIIIMVVAFFLFPKKITEHDPLRTRRALSISLFVFGIFVFLYANIADLADVFTVWATIVLAGVAVFSFEESRRLRKQYKEREERDRREEQLNDIQKWAENGIVAIAPASLQIDTKMILYELDLNLRPVAAKMISVIIYTDKIGGDLKTKVWVASKRVNAIGRAIQKPNKHINIVHARRILIVAFTDVIKAVADLKSQEMKS